MPKYCSNCGTQMEDDSRFCPNCGTSNEMPPTEPTPVNEVPKETAASPVTSFINNLHANPKKLLIPGIAVAAVVVILIVVLALGGSKGPAYGSALDNYFDIFVLGDFSKSSIKALAPEGYWEWREDRYGEDFNDYYEEIEEASEDFLDEMEEEYGKNIKYSYEVTKEKELTEKKLGYIAAYLEERYDIDEDLLTVAYELDLELVVKGSENEEDGDMEIFVLKIDGEWYTAFVALDGDDTTVYFNID